MRVFKLLPVIFLSLAMVACGFTQEELDSFSESLQDSADQFGNNNGQNSSTKGVTISWNPIFIDSGSSSMEAESYRVLYSEPGSRPKEAMSDSTQLALNDVSSLNNYDVLIEGYDSEGNSLFITDYSVM